LQIRIERSTIRERDSIATKRLVEPIYSADDVFYENGAKKEA